MHLRLRSGDAIVSLDLLPTEDGRHRCRVGGHDFEIEPLDVGETSIVVRIAGRIHRALVARDGSAVVVGLAGQVHRFTPESAAEDDIELGGGSSSGRVEAPMPGKILDLLVKLGDRVEAGQPLVILEAMKMEHTLMATIGGTVTDIRVQPGAMVGGGDLLLEVSAEPSS